MDFSILYQYYLIALKDFNNDDLDDDDLSDLRTEIFCTINLLRKCGYDLPYDFHTTLSLFSIYLKEED